MANMVEGGKTPTLPAAELEAIGFALVIFPGAIVRALGHMASEFYASLAKHGFNEPFATACSTSPASTSSSARPR